MSYFRDWLKNWHIGMPQGKVIKVIKKASNDILLESESAKTQEKKKDCKNERRLIAAPSLWNFITLVTAVIHFCFLKIEMEINVF